MLYIVGDTSQHVITVAFLLIACTDAQVVIISDPQLAAEVLDRTKTPHTIDKPTEPQFYKMMDEVCSDSLTSISFGRWQTNMDPLQTKQQRRLARLSHMVYP